MVKYLDPVADARVLGFLYILSGIVTTLLAIFNPANLFFGLLNFIIGLGLVKRKIWAVFLIGVLVVSYGLFLGYELVTGTSLTDSDGMGLILSSALFFWMYSAIVLKIDFNNSPSHAPKSKVAHVPLRD
jgi:hypothetical protein